MNYGTDDQGYYLNSKKERTGKQTEKGKCEERAAKKAAKKSSKDRDRATTRSDKDTKGSLADTGIKDSEGRAPRIHKGAGKALDLPAGIVSDIRAKDCVYRFVTNEGANVQVYLDDWWDVYKDADGNEISRLAGTGRDGKGCNYILMIQKREYYSETQELKRQKVSATLESQQVLNKGIVPEYVPDGQDLVVETRAG